MRINLNFTNEQILHLLNANGYEVEDVLMWYMPYDAEDIVEEELKSYHVKLVYKKCEGKPWEGQEKPLLENYEDYTYEKSVEHIISSLLFERLV